MQSNVHFSQKDFDVPLHPHNAHLLCAPLTIQCPQTSYRKFYARLCSNVLPEYNVVLVADLRNFRKYASMIVLVISTASSLFSSWSSFPIRYSWKALLTETSNANLKSDHHHFLDRKLIIYALIFWSIRSPFLPLLIQRQQFESNSNEIVQRNWPLLCGNLNHQH